MIKKWRPTILRLQAGLAAGALGAAGALFAAGAIFAVGAIFAAGAHSAAGGPVATSTVATTTVATTTVPGSSCAMRSGMLQLSARAIRTSGISPLLIFFDATATTDAQVVTSVAQNVTFTWKFGDSGLSGSGKWLYGSNASANSMNVGSGIVAAHLYRTSGSDASYTATVTASDGTNTASCDIGITAYDPGGSGGFPGSATTCISASAEPTPGSGGCPAGAKVFKTASIQSALSKAYGNGKRLLFKCGDSFAGDDGGANNLTAVKWAIGAYGGCESTQHDRPIFSNSGPNYIFEFSGANGNGTLSDFDCEGNSSSNGGCIWGNDQSGIMYQDTIFNVYSNNEQESFAWAQCSQCGLIEVFQNNMRGSHRDIGTWVNISGFKNYPYKGNVFNDVGYQAIIGSHFDGGAAEYAENAEPVRLFACPGCYVADSDFLNAGPYYAQLKVHAAGLTAAWIGRYTEYVEISDNFFGGTSGANAVEFSPQNSESDERLRYIVIERNVFNGAAPSGRQLQISGVNITVRDNAFLMKTNTAYGIQVCQRGMAPAPQYVEGYNNSFYSAGGANSAAIEISSKSCGGTSDTTNSDFKNNLVYFPGQSSLPVVAHSGSAGLGSGNVASHNTLIVTENPAFKNSSGTFLKITDWKPTAYFSGGASVPGVLEDAVGIAWAPTWDLGAMHH